MSALKNGFHRVLGSGLENYTAPKYGEIRGVQIRFKPSSQQDSVSWYDWKETLHEMIPRYDEAGWLEGFTKINIQHDLVRRDAVGQYFMSDGSINLENNLDMGWGNSRVLGHSQKHILTHEMVHHAHMYVNDFGDRDVDFDKDFIRREVSYYAGSNILEAIAEIGAGIALGHEFPQEIHDFYEEHDGPQEVYEL